MSDNDAIRQAFNDLDRFISEQTKQRLLDLKLPVSYSNKSLSEDYDKGWVVGFRRCLAELQRLAKEMK